MIAHQLTLIRRELWEHRSIWVTPIAIGVVVTLGVMAMLGLASGFAKELDMAICIDRIQTAFDIEVRRLENKWAGLRSFVADKSPVAGYDPEVEGFFWLAGQGGYGIQSSPGLARAAAALVRGDPLPADIQDEGLTEAMISPGRL